MFLFHFVANIHSPRAPALKRNSKHLKTCAVLHDAANPQTQWTQTPGELKKIGYREGENSILEYIEPVNSSEKPCTNLKRFPPSSAAHCTLYLTLQACLCNKKCWLRRTCRMSLPGGKYENTNRGDKKPSKQTLAWLHQVWAFELLTFSHQDRPPACHTCLSRGVPPLAAEKTFRTQSSVSGALIWRWIALDGIRFKMICAVEGGLKSKWSIFKR